MAEKLTVGDFGDNVALLHADLKRNGFDVSPDEVRRKFFGPATRAAIFECQTCNQLEPTGHADDAVHTVLGAGPSAALTIERPPVNRPSLAGSTSTTGPVASIASPPPPTIGPGAAADAVANLQDALLPQRMSLPPRPTSAQLAITRLLPLLRTSSSLRDGASLDRFAQLFVERAAIAPGAWIPVASEAGLYDSQIKEARLTMELGSLTSYNLPLVAELQVLRQSGRFHDGSDLVDFSADEWQALLHRVSTARQAPYVNPDAELAAIQDRLRAAYPMAYVTKVLAVSPAVDLALIRRVVAANPKLDLASPPPKTLNLDWLNAAEGAAARTSLASLRQEIRTYPDFDYRAALQSSAGGVDRHVNPIRVGVSRLLSQAPNFDLRTSRIGKYVVEHPESLKDVDQPTLVIAQIKRMQRVYCVAPDVNAMNVLLGEGIHSAFRIVRMPADVFMARFRDTLGGDAAAKAYAAARSVTAAAAAITWAARLRSAGPLPAAVGTWPPPALSVGDAELQRLLSPGGGRAVSQAAGQVDGVPS